jgi:hypothetical protein
MPPLSKVKSEKRIVLAIVAKKRAADKARLSARPSHAEGGGGQMDSGASIRYNDRAWVRILVGAGWGLTHG